MSPDPRHVLTLTFHGLGPPPHDLPDQEAAFWVGTNVFLATLDAVRACPHVCLTFDDGNSTDATIALPALLERRLRAAFFVVAGRIGRPGYLSAQQIRALDEAGMSIGSHGMQHLPWRRLGTADLRNEILDAKLMIEAVVGKSVQRAACPFGVYDRRALRALRKVGFERVYTSDGGLGRPGAWLQPRITLRCNENVARIDEMLIPDRHVARMRRTAKMWLKRIR